MLKDLIEYAEERLEEAVNNDDMFAIRYWVGYRDGLKAAERKSGEERSEK